jgi:hypothetical protein
MLLALVFLSTGVFSDLRTYNWENLGTGCIYPYWEVNGKRALESCAEECRDAKPTMCTLFSFEHDTGRCFLTQGGQIGRGGCSDETVYKLVKRTHNTDDDRRCGCPSGWKKYGSQKGKRAYLFCRMMDPKAPWNTKYYCNKGRGIPEAWNSNVNIERGIQNNCCDVGGTPELAEQVAVAESVAPGPSNVVSAFALVGFIATIYGAGRHYLQK